MDNIILIVKILYYLVFVFGLYFYSKYKFKKDKTKKFGTIALIIFTLLFGFYGIICGPPGESIGDRHNYAYRFETPGQESFVSKGSFGLFVIESIIQIFTRDSSVLFFIVSAMYFMINIYCYKKIKDTTPFFLLLFFLSTVGLYGFFAIKQALSLAFVNLALTKYFQKKKIISLAFLVIAILFHEAAWIVIPCFILAKLCKGSKYRQLAIYILMIAIAIIFPQISKFIVALFSNIPGMSDQIGSYLDETGSIMLDINMLTIFKSMPYYIITIVAILCRKKYRYKIENYDLLLTLSVFCSIFSLLSVYMYWIFRLATYCYVPCFILASQIAIHLRENNAKIFKITIVGLFLALMIKLLIQYYFIYGGII